MEFIIGLILLAGAISLFLWLRNHLNRIGMATERAANFAERLALAQESTAKILAASYAAQRMTWESLKVRSDNAAIKAGLTPAAKDSPPSIEDVQRIVTERNPEPDATPPTVSQEWANPYAR